ncbi:hypothetical protein DCAR_0728046 [Daucus carota subsp. sativus]|uniref:Uncharacterized protein n=1 Tax=Daucus carota subsp. sativus TaxID=79200 RepID=A0A175Y912_DAUCS|nr:hypothetical protein DCAR_0728046 [Daucus carota subsp. sativus]
MPVCAAMRCRDGDEEAKRMSPMPGGAVGVGTAFTIFLIILLHIFIINSEPTSIAFLPGPHVRYLCF